MESNIKAIEKKKNLNLSPYVPMFSKKILFATHTAIRMGKKNYSGFWI